MCMVPMGDVPKVPMVYSIYMPMCLCCLCCFCDWCGKAYGANVPTWIGTYVTLVAICDYGGYVPKSAYAYMPMVPTLHTGHTEAKSLWYL